MESPSVKVGVGVVIVRDNKVLLGLRKGSHGEGTWSTPGGHLEYGETVKECSEREVLEEIGVPVNVFEPHYLGWNEKIWPDNKHYITIYTLGVIYDDAVPKLMEPEKCEEWRWFGKNELSKLKLFETTRMRDVLIQALEDTPHLLEAQ